MEEILALQRQLQEVQETKTSNKLSERVVVDLVQLVIKEYNQKLFFSQDGMEYIVPSHLDSQINDIIQQQGRVNILDLPNYVKVGIERIENRIDGIQAKYQNLIRLEDHLMTQQYLDEIAEEINEQLQQRAQIPLGEITSKYEFPLQFVKKIIEDRIPSIIQGNILAADKLTTLSFQDIMKAKLRGCLRATTKPYSLSTLRNDYHIEGSILNSLIEDLIQNNDIDGKIQQGQFIPTRFVKNQENIVKKFFAQNKYIEYKFLQEQLFIQKPREFLKQNFKDKCIFLENCCYSKDELKGIQENIEAILLEDGQTDLSLMLPTILTDQDIESLIFRHMDMQSVELKESFIFSHSFIHSAVQSFREPIVQIIYNAPQKLVEDNNNESTNKKSKKSKKNDKKSSQKSNQNKNSLFSETEIMENLIKCKIIEREDRDEYTDQLFMQILLPEIAKFYDQIKVELFENKKSASSEIITEMTNKITDLMISIQYVARGFTQIEENYETINLNQFIEKTLYAQRLLIENIVIFFCKKYCVQLPSNLFLEQDTNKQSENPKNYSPHIECGNIKANKVFKGKTELVTAIEMIPKEYSKFLKEAMELYLKKNFQGLLTHLVENQETIGVKANLDKRSEKNFTFFIKYTVKEALKKDIKNLTQKQIFEKIISYYLLEKQNLFFIGNPDEEKFINAQTLVILETSKDEQIKQIFKKAIEIYLVKPDSQDWQVLAPEETLAKYNNELISLIKIQ